MDTFQKLCMGHDSSRIDRDSRKWTDLSTCDITSERDSWTLRFVVFPLTFGFLFFQDAETCLDLSGQKNVKAWYRKGQALEGLRCARERQEGRREGGKEGGYPVRETATATATDIDTETDTEMEKEQHAR